MFRLFAITLALLSLQAFAQTPPADPPVASLPLPEVAVQSLSSAPSPNQRSLAKGATPEIDIEAAEADPQYDIPKRRRLAEPLANEPSRKAPTQFVRQAL